MGTDTYFRDIGTQLFTLCLMPAFALGICFIYVKVFIEYNLWCCKQYTRNDNSQIRNEVINSVLENQNRKSETEPLLYHTEINNHSI